MPLRSPWPALLTAMLFVAPPAARGGGTDIADFAPRASAEQKCTQLASIAFRDAKLLKITHHGAGAFVTPAKTTVSKVPAFCQVSASLHPSTDSDIRVEVWLPAEGWNGKYLGLGNGGYGGSLDYNALVGGLARGYAVAHTDMGTAPSTSTDGSPLLNHPEKWLDWGYRSTHLMTLFAKDVTTRSSK